MKSRAGLPAGIWVLGCVSLLMDVSSETIHSLLPVFLVSVLGANALTVGLIEGVAEATALIVRVFSGVLSDILGRRKPLAVLGYSLGALSKPLFALAGSAGLVFFARFMDRIGKGIRGAPRDALVADLAPPELRGAAYGLRQSLDNVGAFVGPLLGIGLMLLTANDFRAVFWLALIPGIAAPLLLQSFIHEPRTVVTGRRTAVDWAGVKLLGATYWWTVAIGGLFMLARFSEAFLVLRVQESGLSAAWAPLVLVVMNVANAAIAYPVGRLADRMSHRVLLAIGLVLLVAADILLAAAGSIAGYFVGIAVWGLHMGATQGVLATMVANRAPAELRGTAFGVFNLIGGLCALVASGLAGLLWDLAGPAATFSAGALLAVGALLAIALGRRFAPETG